MGNGLGSRMLHYGHFETGLHLRYPELQLFVRNMCDEGNTPSFRPHSGRGDQLGFPGAEAFHHPYTGGNTANGVGHFETEEQWLAKLAPDVILAFFGFNESFLGGAGIANFRAELDAFLKHTTAQQYNGSSPAEVILVSPTAFEDRSDTMSVPDGLSENANLAAYTSVMEAVAKEHGVRFVNAFNASLLWQEESRRPLTVDGALLSEEGYRRLSAYLIDEVFGASEPVAAEHAELVHAPRSRTRTGSGINDFKIPNGVHVFGRRYNPFGPANYPFEIDKIREMTAIRDEAIWAAARGETIDVAGRDAATSSLPPVETNYKPGGKNGALTFLEGEEALATISVPEGYHLQQWATEKEFPNLANPVQLSFDNRGRLWVATMPSYPHYRPGDPKPDDKLLILEDTDGDGKADKETIFADGLHLPMGFEFAPEGVYPLPGHQPGAPPRRRRGRPGRPARDHPQRLRRPRPPTTRSVPTAPDPSGAILMCEGTFLRTERRDGLRSRARHQRRLLPLLPPAPAPRAPRTAFDPQPLGHRLRRLGAALLLAHVGHQTEWMLPGSIKPRYGSASPGSQDLIDPSHRVRPTSGIEFLSSRHFPDEVQGDMLLNNTIGSRDQAAPRCSRTGRATRPSGVTT